MMKFRTKFDEHDRVYMNHGSGIKKVYQYKETNDGAGLVEIGETDLYAYIQSHADSVDIHKILERCALMDDYSLMNKVPGVYMDITEMPKSLAEAYDKIQNAKDLFDRMPTDIKQSYDNNFVQFIESIGDEKFVKVTSEFLSKMKAADEGVHDTGEVKE